MKEIYMESSTEVILKQFTFCILSVFAVVAETNLADLDS